MMKFAFLILIFPTLALADLKRISGFGFEPSPADENRVQVQGWERLTSSPGSSYGAYTRRTDGTSAKDKVDDGMSIYTWDTKSETALSPKTIIVTTAFMAPDEKEKTRREIYIFDYSKTLGLEAVSYCLPSLTACTSVNAKSCAGNKSADAALIDNHARLLASHYIGVGAELPPGVAEKFKSPNVQLTKTVCSRYFPATKGNPAKSGTKPGLSGPTPKTGKH